MLQILLIIIILYIIYKIRYIENFDLNNKLSFNKLPNNIWMYWENKNNGVNKPSYLDLCNKTVFKHCSKDFNIYVLNEKNVYQYIPNLRKDLNKKLNIPQKTDYIRYWLLYLYGGIWLDYDIIVFKSLMPLLKNLKNYDYIGAGCHSYTCKKTGYPEPANWFMASRKGSTFIKRCINDCDKYLNSSKLKFNYFKFGRETMWKNIKIEKKKNNWDYFHLKSNCLERDSKFKKIRNNRLLSNEDIDINCLDKSIFVPIYNTSPGFPDWFKNMNENEILEKNMLISKFFRKSLM